MVKKKTNVKHETPILPFILKNNLRAYINKSELEKKKKEQLSNDDAGVGVVVQEPIAPHIPNPNPNEIPSPVNYRFPKSTKIYDQGQKMLFALNQYSNDHRSINLTERI